jgi:RsiW-degrading membrane proteinase PrsW (M82 family)
MIFPVAIAIAIPILFLYSVHWLDLYGSDRPRTVLLCFAWGFVAFLLAFLANHFTTDILGFDRAFVATRTGPFVEEVFKSLILIYLVRRANFTYFVDGAIYGFASGIGFAVIENLRYIQLYPDQALLLVITRDFSTALMHGTATGLTGIALGRFRLARGSSGIPSLLLGWAGAMLVHYTFNNVALSSLDSTLTEWILVGIGLGGVVLVAATILWGLRDEKKWLRDELGERLHVSEEEASIVQHMGDLDELLAPIEKHFGKNKRNQVAHFLHLEAQLGLKQEAEDRTTDPKLRAELASQIAASEQELDQERRKVGLYVLSFVRAIIPPTDWSLWARLGQALTRTTTTRTNIWTAASARAGQAGATSEVSMYTRVQSELEARSQAANLTVDHVDELPEAMQKCMHWVMKEETVALHHVAAGLGHEEQAAQEMLSHLVARGFLRQTSHNGQIVYRSRVVTERERADRLHLWQSLQRRLSTNS